MKRIATFLLAALVLAICLSPVAIAQTSATPTLNNTLYKYQLANTKQYALSQRDTLPQPTSAGVAVVFKGAPAFASLVLTAADSCTADIYVDKRVVGMTTFTNIFADSIKSASTITPAVEWVLRDGSTEKFAGLYLEYRVRVAFRATGNGDNGKPATKKYSLYFMWKP